MFYEFIGYFSIHKKIQKGRGFKKEVSGPKMIWGRKVPNAPNNSN